jgi:hypothetical protein
MKSQALLLAAVLVGAGRAFETPLVAERLHTRAAGGRCCPALSALPEHMSREVVLRRIGASGAALLLGNVPIVHAAVLPPGESVSEGVAQNVRKAASSIPGMGPPDVGFPAGMLGRWSVRRLLVDVEFPQGQAGLEEDPTASQLLQRKGVIEQFSARFIQGKGGLIVADRDYNARSMEKSTEGSSVEVQWKATNPNVLTMSYPNGLLREVKVIPQTMIACDYGTGLVQMLIKRRRR